MGINSQTRNDDILMKFIRKENGLCKLICFMSYDFTYCIIKLKFAGCYHFCIIN